MRKIESFILGVLVFSCGVRTTENKNDQTKIMDTVPAPLISDSNKLGIVYEAEDFEEFFEKFKTDSLFQVERVKFPWRWFVWESDEEAVVLEEIKQEDWRYSSFYYEESYATREIDAYTQNIKTYGDTVRLEVRGVDNGIHTDYEFAMENNKWFLVSGKDYSN